MAHILKVNGSIRDIQPRQSKFTLDECYNYLDCELVELLHLEDGNVMIVDEEGKVKKLAKGINIRATTLYGKDLIVGDVIICKSSQF